MHNTLSISIQREPLYKDDLTLVKLQDDVCGVKELMHYYNQLLNGLSKQSLDIEKWVIPFDDLTTIKEDLIRIKDLLFSSIKQLQKQYPKLKKKFPFGSVIHTDSTTDINVRFWIKFKQKKTIHQSILIDLKNELQDIEQWVTNYEELLAKGRELQLDVKKNILTQASIEEIRNHLGQLRNKINTSVFVLGSSFSRAKERIDQEIHLQLMRMGV